MEEATSCLIQEDSLNKYHIKLLEISVITVASLPFIDLTSKQINLIQTYLFNDIYAINQN